MEEKIGSADEAWKARRKIIWRNRLILLAIVVVLASDIFGIYKLVQRYRDGNDVMQPNVQVGPMPGKTEEQIQRELDEQVDEFVIGYTINGDIVFQDGNSEGNILFENPIGNGKNTRLEIYLGDDDTGTLLYETKLLKPNSYVEKAPLLVALEKGEYACTGYVYGYRYDGSYIGRAPVSITIHVQS